MVGDEALNAKKHDEAITAYSTVLSLSHSTPNIGLLKKWMRTVLIRNSVGEVLGAAGKVCLV